MEIKEGTLFVALSTTPSGDVTKGSTYEIIGRDSEGDVFFLDDIGEENYAMSQPDGFLYVTGRYEIL